MEIQLEAQDTVPQELGYVTTADADSFTQTLQTLQSNQKSRKGLRISGPIRLDAAEKNSLKLLPKAFGLNRIIMKFELWRMKVEDILVAEALREGLKNNKVTSIRFEECEIVSNVRLIGSMCEGLKERSTGFQLNLSNCSPEFVKPILEASSLKCFSLEIWGLQDCSTIERPLKNLLSTGRLYYVSLVGVDGLKENVFLLLGRCLFPKLKKLILSSTEVPTSALKLLIRSLKKVLNSGRSNLFEFLHFGQTPMDSKLCFAICRLLRSDVVENVWLCIREAISRAVVKDIASTVANTRKLRHLHTGEYMFSSGTNFTNFKLQKKTFSFKYPFGVNPTVAEMLDLNSN